MNEEEEEEGWFFQSMEDLHNIRGELGT